MMTKPIQPRAAQQGISLIMAMIMLVGLMAGAVSLFRSMDTASLVAGNMAQKHATSMAGEIGVQRAFAWLEAQPRDSRYVDNAAGGYCASQHAADLLPAGWDPRVNWTACVAPASLPPDAAGNEVEYFIHRLCLMAGPPKVALSPQTCSIPSAITRSKNDSSKGPGSFLEPPMTTSVAYRVTVRIQSTNGTRSYVQGTLTMRE